MIEVHGYPPCWSRDASFATLINIILEQQVSLASAKAAFTKLEHKIGTVEPEKFLLLSDEEMKSCYFSRQKIIYAKALALAIVKREVLIEQLIHMENDEIISLLTKIKGIGEWSVTIFLMMALHRLDCFPEGDIALIKSVKEVKNLSLHTLKQDILNTSTAWKPFRTIAAYMLWHAYLSKRRMLYTS